MSQDKTDLPGNKRKPEVTETPEAAGKDAGINAGNPEGEQDSAPSRDSRGTAAEAVDVYAEEAARVNEEAGAEYDPEDVDALRDALVQKTEEAEKYRDQALRAAAEADNVRKRAQRDAESARKFALEKFAGELLGVRDSLEMGLKAGADEQTGLDNLVEGMELTHRMLASAMEKFGIEVVNPEGEAFDPELHEAVSMQETDAQSPNTVVAVIQKGYTLNGRVLRAAMVVVAQAPTAK